MKSLLRPIRLKCENLTNPKGLNNYVPRFSWALTAADKSYNKRQTAYRIVVGDHKNLLAADTFLNWDSGKVVSDQSLYVRYQGESLRSDQHLYWAVLVWDEHDEIADLSQVQTFSTGLIEQSAWSAKWIARYFVLPAGRELPADNIYDNPWQARPADYLRRELNITQPIYRATAYITALGLYEFFINGVRVGEDVMAPGWTDYHQRVEYQTHDISEFLIVGDNAIGAIIGEGWYSGRVGHNQRRAGNHYGGRPAFLCQIHIEYSDGSVQKIVTDQHWKTSQGAICYSDFLMGELYDARLELAQWHVSGCDESAWQPVEVFIPEPAAPKLHASRSDAAREVSEHCATLLHRSDSGGYVFDIGQNLAGYVKLTLSAARDTKFSLKHAEILDENGELYTKNLRHAVSTDHYIAKGEGVEVFKPHFTFHGFRYIELTTAAAFDIANIELTGIAICTAMPETGQLSTGHPMVNQLISNIRWSQKGNFLSVPTDCPQRDERLGWSADAQVFWRTAGYNMDVSAFLDKWFEDIVDAQLADGAFTDIAPSRPLNPYKQSAQPGAPGWGDAPIILAWQHYLRYADLDLVKKHYPALQRWMEHIATDNRDFIRTEHVYNNYGDWLSVGPHSDRTVVAKAYWIHVADIMAKIASVLKKQADHLQFSRLAANIRSAFVTRFVAADGAITGNTQTAYLLALDFKILPCSLREKAKQQLIQSLKDADDHLQTGFLGVKHLCPVLSDIGRQQHAYQLLLNETYPSWGFSIAQGATTIWERWDGWTQQQGFQSAAMNSFNHYAYGSVGEWLYARMAGIDWDEAQPGFKIIVFNPAFNRNIGWLDAQYKAATGTVKSHWRFCDEQLHWSISIPPNCQGKVVVSPELRLTYHAAPLSVLEQDNQITYLYGSGEYYFSADANNIAI